MRKFIAVTIFVCLNIHGMKRKRGVENTPSRPITRAYKKKCIDLEQAYSKILPVWESIPAISNEYRKITFHPGFMQNLEDTLRNTPDAVMNHYDYVRSIAYSPDGKNLATACFSGQIKLWNIDEDTSEPVREFDHGDWLKSIAYSPDCRQLASGGSNGKIKLWNVAERIQFSNRLEGKRDHLSCGQYDLLKAIQEVYLLHKFAKARRNKPIEPIALDSPYTSVFKSFPRCIQIHLEQYVQLYKTEGYKSPHETL